MTPFVKQHVDVFRVLQQRWKLEEEVLRLRSVEEELLLAQKKLELVKYGLRSVNNLSVSRDRAYS